MLLMKTEPKMKQRKKLILWISAMLLFAGSLSVGAQNVSFNNERLTLKQAFEKIESVSNYKIAYNASQLNVNKQVVLNQKNKSVTQVMDDLLSDTGCTYEIKGNQIVITPLESKATSSDKITVKGKVVDETGEGVIGASVVEKGTGNGTVTDYEGNFTVSNVSPNSDIEISYIGYTTQTVKANNGNKLSSIVLQQDDQILSEVVVVGYGSQKRANLTGAVATISSKDINNRPVASAAGALQGADPSVNLTFNTGSMDSDYSIDIRGVASVNGGTPLILCDGMEVSLNQINPNDIESISVLKDASASAIYGAKASSGVILITTKSGKDSDGKVNVNYNGRIGWRKNTTSTDFITTGFDHVNIVNQFYNVYQGKLMWGYTGEDLEMLEARRYDETENPDRPWTVEKNGKLYFYSNFDWYDYFYKTTRPEHEHNISITGGNKKVNYFISGRFLQQDGIFKIYNDKYRNLSFRAKLNAEIAPFIHYTGNFNFNYTNYKYAGYYDEQMTIHSLQSNVNSAVMPLSPDGQTIQYVNTMTGANSPLGAGHAGFLTANEARNSRGNKDYIISNQLDIDVFKDLVITASYAYKYRNRIYKRRSMPFEYLDKSGTVKTFTSGAITDYWQELHGNTNRHSVNVYGTYTHTWNKQHNFKAVAGMQYEDQRFTQLSVKQNDLLSKDLSSFSVATGESTITEEISAYRTLGYFARINYDYEGKYLFEASGRFDGSSRFSENDRWGFFPSASVGWRISQEKFWEPLSSFWNNAKIRFSIGSLGNQQVSNYAYFDKISTDNVMSYTFDGNGRANYASVSSPLSNNLTWETVTTYNWGLDLSFFDSRLTATIDIFRRDTKDMLTHSLTLPSVYGATTPKENCADLRTNGWEIYLRWNDHFKLAGHRFDYGISATLGDYKSKITKFNNPDKLISDYYEGMTLGEIWGYKVEGLFGSDEEAAAYQAQINDKAVNQRVYNSKVDNHLMAGDVKFIDVNGDNVINEGSGTVDDPGDKSVIGNSLPRYSYSFRLDASYRGFDFSAFFQGVGKCDWFPTTYAYDFWGPYSFPSLSFIHKDFMDNCWSEDNPGGYFPRPRGYQSYSGGSLSVPTDRYLQNAAYLRLKNLTIGYTLPLKSTKIFQSIRVYFTGENLWYTSPMKKYSKTVDPELANTSGTYNSGSGVGYGYSKSFSFGVDVKF
jgi:TonB-linked SusC/RagA family outer membrane protein